MVNIIFIALYAIKRNVAFDMQSVGACSVLGKSPFLSYM